MIHSVGIPKGIVFTAWDPMVKMTGTPFDTIPRTVLSVVETSASHNLAARDRAGLPFRAWTCSLVENGAAKIRPINS